MKTANTNMNTLRAGETKAARTSGKAAPARRAILSAVLAAMLLACLLLAGCGADSASNAGADGAAGGGDVIGTCTLTVQDILDETECEITEGDTVLDILVNTDLAVATESGTAGAWVEAIEGLANGDKGEMSGWLFTVNGEMPMDYSDKIEVNDGDVIVWEFSEGM